MRVCIFAAHVLSCVTFCLVNNVNEPLFLLPPIILRFCLVINKMASLSDDSDDEEFTGFN